VFQEPGEDPRCRWRHVERRGENDGSPKKPRGLREGEERLQACLHGRIPREDDDHLRIPRPGNPRPDRRRGLQTQVALSHVHAQPACQATFSVALELNRLGAPAHCLRRVLYLELGRLASGRF